VDGALVRYRPRISRWARFRRGPVNIRELDRLRDLRAIRPQSIDVSDRVVSERVHYVVVWADGTDKKTALVLASGEVTGDWPTPLRFIPVNDLDSEEAVEGVIDTYGGEQVFGSYAVTDLGPRWERLPPDAELKAD
jgi:hypothetical protein